MPPQSPARFDCCSGSGERRDAELKWRWYKQKDDCLIRYGAHWRGTATEALMTLGSTRPRARAAVTEVIAQEMVREQGISAMRVYLAAMSAELVRNLARGGIDAGTLGEAAMTGTEEQAGTRRYAHYHIRCSTDEAIPRAAPARWRDCLPGNRASLDRRFGRARLASRTRSRLLLAR
jgi:hypothetical protein